jgi:hypothetical protein
LGRVIFWKPPGWEQVHQRVLKISEEVRPMERKYLGKLRAVKQVQVSKDLGRIPGCGRGISWKTPG